MSQNAKQILESISSGSYSSQIEQKRECSVKTLEDVKESEAKALEMNRECVPMPSNVEKRLEDWKNEID